MADINFKIDKEKCVKCGLCNRDCIVGIISKDNENYPVINSKVEKYCIKCQHCLAICPVGAVSILNKEPQNSTQKREVTNSDDMLGLIQTRRSCRHYKQENLPQETIDKLKNMLNWIPTGINYRGLHFSVVENIDIMTEIRDDVNKKLQKLVKFIPSIGILKKLKHMSKDENGVFRGAPHMIVVSVDKKAPCPEIDPIIALSYFDLYAQTFGVGTLWCGFAYMALKLFPSIAKKMQIPKTHKIAYAMMFGAPAVKYARGTQPESAGFSLIK